MSTAYPHAATIARELGVTVAQVEKTVALLADGATIPFIARYRKEATGNLDEVQIGAVDERRTYLSELDARKATVLGEIGKQGKLTDELKTRIEKTLSKTELEDLYLPYKPKRRTRATSWPRRSPSARTCARRCGSRRSTVASSWARRSRAKKRRGRSSRTT